MKIDSSVLVLLVSIPIANSKTTEPWVLLTRRSLKLRSHPGEISFPGGRIENSETFEQVRYRFYYQQ